MNSLDMDYDALIQLAVIHYQFETIHPFYDGNGRTGRILNVLYLVLKDRLDTPILYLSSYINKNKKAYYEGLQQVRDSNNWEQWVLYILEGIKITSYNTLNIMKDITTLIESMILDVKKRLPNIYSMELIDAIFYEVYTKISFVEKGVGVTRKTASSYLVELERAGFLVSEKIGREKIYLNKKLLDLIRKARF